jgi:CubicO group peptidase (beta-lactamase class C family)
MSVAGSKKNLSQDVVTRSCRSSSLLKPFSEGTGQCSVFTRRDQLFNVPGRYGWGGGYGTSWCSDAKENLTDILLTQRMMESPQMPLVMADFWTLSYQAIDD